MHKLRDVTRRSSLLLLAAAFLTSWLTTIPVVVSADQFFTSEFANRTLLLSSSSPGWAFTDGAGNTTNAPPGSGANGQKTSEEFTFNTNTDKDTAGQNINAFTLQYCTGPAGNCTNPGDGAFTTTPPQKSTLDIVLPGSGSTATLGNGADMDGTHNWDIKWKGVSQAGWTIATTHTTDADAYVGSTEKNFLTLKCLVANSCTPIPADHGDAIEIDIYAQNNGYITNPGSGAFFVRIKDFSDSTTLDDTTIMDGGVTVANVMSQSIQITTKVLETMSFSVGTEDPYAYTAGTFGPCDAILPKAPSATTPDNAIALGDPSAEFSLSTTQAYDAYSLWRLSSNSANGASVYYSGDTLRSTEGSFIDRIGTADDTATLPKKGVNQFGLALNGDFPTGTSSITYPGDQSYYDTHHFDSGYVTAYQANDTGPEAWHLPSIAPLAAQAAYSLGGNGAAGLTWDGTTAGPEFAFNNNANTTPVLIASENTQVVDCATGQVRYVADVAGSTAAGIYTTKINYLAAPEY